MKTPLSTLVIEDDDAMRDLLQDLLDWMGHRVHTAADGQEGIQLFEQQKIPIVLCDLGMPGVDGWEVCSRIKESAPQTVVIVVTGWRISENALQMRNVDLILQKPFTIGDLCSVLEEAEGVWIREEAGGDTGSD